MRTPQEALSGEGAACAGWDTPAVGRRGARAAWGWPGTPGRSRGTTYPDRAGGPVVERVVRRRLRGAISS